MEKNRPLDTCYKAAGLILLGAMLYSCALPRIAILHDPLTAEEHINLGLSYERNKEFDAALREYEAASPKLPIAYLYMGNVYFQRNEFEAGEKLYKRAIDKTQSPYAYNNLAWLYYVSGRRLDEAEKLAARAVELSPDSKDFRDTLTRIEEKRRQEAPLRRQPFGCGNSPKGD